MGALSVLGRALIAYFFLAVAVVAHGAPACERSASLAIDTPLDEAVAAWSSCIEARAEDSEQQARAYHGRGLVRLRGGHLAYALEDFNQAISLDKDFVEAYFSRGLAYQQSGLKDEFFNDMKHVIEHTQSSEIKAKAFRQRGEGYSRLNLFAAAVTDLNRSIDLDPGQGEAHFLRAEIYAAARRDDEALADVNASLQRNSKQQAAYIMRAALNARALRYRDAVNDTESALVLDPSSAVAHAQRCDVLSALAIAELAVESCQQVARLQPGNEVRQLEHALARWQLGEMDAARSALGFMPGDNAHDIEKQLIEHFPRLLGERLLANLGYAIRTVDGIVDADTEQALALFQSAHGQPARSSFDAQTLAHLRSVLHARIPYRAGSSDLQPNRPVLRIESGPATGRRITLWSIPTTLGRSGGQVARIESDGEAFAMVHVEGEPVPTINGQPMSGARVRLKHGDVIELFGVSIRFSHAL